MTIAAHNTGIREGARSLQQDIEITLRELAEFVLGDRFQTMVAEMYASPETDRATFVDSVILNPRERLKRGIVSPPKVKIQRSTFGDERPTLFCISKRLRDHAGKKVTFTYDNAMV